MRRKYLTFNRIEWNIFDHRYCLLEDCIFEMIESSIESDLDGTGFGQLPENWKDTIALGGELYNKVTKKSSPIPQMLEKWNRNHVARLDVTELSMAEKFVLADVVDGNTWFNEFEDYKADYKHWKETGETGYYYDPKVHGLYGTPSEQLKAARSIERKLKNLGIVTRFP
tara:strand:- start:13028 stop:13534 length:507 start_codon:yes stop_codon:yes gene_type:complete